MNYLLDTRTLLWSLLSPNKLSEKTVQILENENNDIFFSAVSIWEIAIKSSKNKILLDGGEPSQIHQEALNIGFSELGLSCEVTASFSSLPYFDNHHDPFDRMLIWSSIYLRLPILSADRKFKQYENLGLNVVW